MEILSDDKSPKKKGKKKKRGMSEERRIFLEQDRLKRENKMSNENNESLRFSWRKILTELNSSDMRKDIEVAKNATEHILDIKDFRVNSMVKELDESEEQYGRNIKKHIEIIKKIEEIYESRSNNYQNKYNQDLISILNESKKDKDEIEKFHNETELLLRSAMLAGNERIKEILENAESASIYKIENMRDEGKNIIKMALVDLENKISSYRNDLDSIISKYLNDTLSRRISYEKLKANDSKNQQLIVGQLNQMGELITSINKYKDMIAKLSENGDETVKNIIAEKSVFQKKYSEIKERFENEQKIDKISLNNLTKEFNETVKVLKKIKKKTQDCLTFINICRKLERPSDKIFPLRYNQTDEFSCFDIFWYKVGLVELDNIKLRNKLEKLKKESYCLKECVKCRLEG